MEEICIYISYYDRDKSILEKPIYETTIKSRAELFDSAKHLIKMSMQEFHRNNNVENYSFHLFINYETYLQTFNSMTGEESRVEEILQKWEQILPILNERLINE